METQEKKIKHEERAVPVCPHCGHAHERDWDAEEGKFQCSSCEQVFEIEVIVERYFTTSKIEAKSNEK